MLQATVDNLVNRPFGEPLPEKSAQRASGFAPEYYEGTLEMPFFGAMPLLL
jgi:hypothetical protein